MTTTTVYRVEHIATGEGPYIRSNRDTNWDAVPGLHRAHNMSDAHPGPYADDTIGYVLRDEHSFGFSSRKQLDKWFKGFKKKLHAGNFVIRIFEAPADTTVISDFQAIFVKDDARLIQTLPAVRNMPLP